MENINSPSFIPLLISVFSGPFDMFTSSFFLIIQKIHQYIYEYIRIGIISKECHLFPQTRKRKFVVFIVIFAYYGVLRKQLEIC